MTHRLHANDFTVPLNPDGTWPTRVSVPFKRVKAAQHLAHQPVLVTHADAPGRYGIAMPRGVPPGPIVARAAPPAPPAPRQQAYYVPPAPAPAPRQQAYCVPVHTPQAPAPAPARRPQAYCYPMYTSQAPAAPPAPANQVYGHVTAAAPTPGKPKGPSFAPQKDVHHWTGTQWVSGPPLYTGGVPKGATLATPRPYKPKKPKKPKAPAAPFAIVPGTPTQAGGVYVHNGCLPANMQAKFYQGPPPRAAPVNKPNDHQLVLDTYLRYTINQNQNNQYR